MKDNIVIILCKLEQIFPPAFFDIMVHVAIHLPREAELAGPVQYRWMYPIERTLGRYKRYVRNKARPEGSIAECYVANECLPFAQCIFVILRQDGIVPREVLTLAEKKMKKSWMCSVNESDRWVQRNW